MVRAEILQPGRAADDARMEMLVAQSIDIWCVWKMIRR
jgi:hypothetical protein